MITVDHLTKTFGTVRAVDDLSFSVRPGAVTGFLGPNGAGKTTTLRMLLGLVAPTSGSATIDGRRYTEIDQPGRVVGAALEAASFHPGRSALDHLRVFAPQIGISDARCRELLDMVGLADVADRRVGGYSLGMRQRLGLATTLLGDPPVLVLDEPANGLDPGGIRWLRELLRFFASQGRTVLVSSHVLSEVQQTVDDVVIIAHGRLVHASPLTDLAAMAARHVEVASPDAEALRAVLDGRGWRYTPASRDGVRGFDVADVSAAEVGAAAFGAGVELHALTQQEIELEDVFLSLTGQSTDAATTGTPEVAA
ncbi:ABC transporter ATP-binding protein [Mumia sp. DW29H23]|uniref:ABC transporter ATP-binding protein n=1 Tax=Mumia sp. DW29H23 TaxID=3421241 RepID=UPI003D680917